MMQEKDKRLLISGAQIIDGTGSKPFLGNIIVLGDRIESVTKGSKLSRKIENLKNTIDAKNLTVMPGLIDAHCHITFDEPSSNDELFFHRREYKLPDTLRNHKFLAKVIAFLNSENTCIYITRMNFNCNLLKMLIFKIG